METLCELAVNGHSSYGIQNISLQSIVTIVSLSELKDLIIIVPVHSFHDTTYTTSRHYKKT